MKTVPHKLSEPSLTLVITEGIAGMWHYHVSHEGSFTRGLCGAKTMQTSIQLKDWKVPFGEHFPKRPTWCDECARRAHI